MCIVFSLLLFNSNHVLGLSIDTEDFYHFCILKLLEVPNDQRSSNKDIYALKCTN